MVQDRPRGLLAARCERSAAGGADEEGEHNRQRTEEDVLTRRSHPARQKKTAQNYGYLLCANFLENLLGLQAKFSCLRKSVIPGEEVRV